MHLLSRKWGIPDGELPVVVYLATRARVAPGGDFRPQVEGIGAEGKNFGAINGHIKEEKNGKHGKNEDSGSGGDDQDKGEEKTKGKGKNGRMIY